MPLNTDIVGMQLGEIERSWEPEDCMLYALAVGAGSADPHAELELTTENTTGVPLQVLPTFAIIVGSRRLPDDIGDIDRKMIVHGAQSVAVSGPLPPSGRCVLQSTVVALYDKGSGAAVVVDHVATDPATGTELFTCSNTTFIRGEGGFGGDRGPSGPPPSPEREPDVRVGAATSRSQALLYRLCGDHNPLHSDPAVATAAGFERPILHGLCTYGFTARLLSRTVCGGDVARFRSMSARFARPVLPGDELTVEAWDLEDGTLQFRTLVGDSVVVDGGQLTYV